MTICNDCKVVGKMHQIWCKATGNPCAHVRYCAVSMKYYQTDAANYCKVRTNNGEQKHEADAHDSI